MLYESKKANMISYKSIFLSVLLFVLDMNNATAQTLIEGSVSTVDNEILPFVTIAVKGTTSGVTSDIDGKFRLELPGDIDQPILVFSFVGFKTQEIPIGSGDFIRVVMEEDSFVLDELVVVGYAVQKKVDVTGAVSSIKIDKLEKSALSGVDQAMQGLAAGVRVTQNTGAPGEGVAVRIRGVGSINSGNAPLYIVDGIPTKDAMNSVSISDIESITILKDAASAAIYGSRANNGVVLITTKKGKVNSEAQITFKTSYSIQNHGKLTEMTNRDQYIELYNEAANNDNALIANTRLHRKLIPDDLKNSLPDVDHLEELFRTAAIRNYYLGVSGGGEKTTYNISGSYFDQEGIVIGSDFQRTTGRVSVNSDVKKWLNMGINLNVSKSKTNIVGSSGDGFGGNGGGILRYALFRTSAIPILDANGEFVDLPDNPEFFGDGYSPVGLAHNTHNLKETTGIFGDINARITFNENLSFSSKFGIDNTDSNQRRFNRTWGTNDRINSINSLNVDDDNQLNWSFTNHLNFNKSINKVHNISALVGTESISNSGKFSTATAREFPDQLISLVSLQHGIGKPTVSEDFFDFKLLSFFGNVTYNYNEKYMASAIIRRDGSSRFAKANRWGTFYSGSLGWRLDKESFLINSSIIDQLKIRAGFGAIGNQDIPNFAYLEQIGPNKNYPFGGIDQSGYATTVKGNSDIKWETSTQWDIGVDLNMYEGKLGVTIDYFYKVIRDMLTEEILPTSSGFVDKAWINSGNVLNSGIELELSHNNNIGKLSYSVNANIATLHNEVLELDVPLLGGRIDNGVFATKTEKGHSVGAFYLYEMEGIFQNEADIITHAFQGNAIEPGDVMFKDQNGDGVIDSNDKTFVGSAIPDVIYGLNIGLNYKNFDMSIFFQGASGQEVYSQVNTDIEGFYRPFNLTKKYYDQRWTGEGTSNTDPRASWKGKSNNARASTRFLEDGSYMRLKNLQIGYVIPTSLINKWSINRMRIYFSGTNLLTSTKFGGLEPEITTSDNSSSEGDVAAGIDWGTYPTAKSFMMGINITF